MKNRPAILLLEDGKKFYGKLIGTAGTTKGEICFNTGMIGYQEIFTDPSYCGQIIVMANAHIGNYGISKNESESSDIQIEGLVCRNFSEIYSRYGEGTISIEDHFQKENKTGISEVDTRAVIRHIRKKGAMNAIVSSEVDNIEKLKKELERTNPMKGAELSSKATTSKPYVAKGNKEGQGKRIALLDLGCKESIIKMLTERGCDVKVFPMNESFENMLKYDPQAFVISNGPGDPSAIPKKIIDNIKRMIDSKLPVLGICLGHQLIAICQGLKTEKMHQGHRGINHPIKNLKTGKGEIVSQNHGFVIKGSEIEKDEIEITHKHLNDNTIAGISIPSKKTSSIQYHPEASPGPHDTRYLFDSFIKNI